MFIFKSLIPLFAMLVTPCMAEELYTEVGTNLLFLSQDSTPSDISQNGKRIAYAQKIGNQYKILTYYQNFDEVGETRSLEGNNAIFVDDDEMGEAWSIYGGDNSIVVDGVNSITSLSLNQNGQWLAFAADAIVYLYHYKKNLKEWVLFDTIQEDGNSNFGSSIDLSANGKIIVIGSSGDDQGSVYKCWKSNPKNCEPAYEWKVSETKAVPAKIDGSEVAIGAKGEFAIGGKADINGGQSEVSLVGEEIPKFKIESTTENIGTKVAISGDARYFAYGASIASCTSGLFCGSITVRSAADGNAVVGNVIFGTEFQQLGFAGITMNNNGSRLAATVIDNSEVKLLVKVQIYELQNNFWNIVHEIKSGGAMPSNQDQNSYAKRATIAFSFSYPERLLFTAPGFLLSSDESRIFQYNGSDFEPCQNDADFRIFVNKNIVGRNSGRRKKCDWIDKKKKRLKYCKGDVLDRCKLSCNVCKA